jgi:quercetin dioxygenase-like cupin family protein
MDVLKNLLFTQVMGTVITDGAAVRTFKPAHQPMTEGFMTKASRTFVHHCAGVAIVVGLVSCFSTWAVTRFVTASSAQLAPAAAKALLVQPLADLPGREVRITLLDRAPGSSSPPHRHPGHHTFGYVIEGTYEFAIDGEPSRVLNAGETFYEPPTAVHSVSRNPSADKRTKIIVFMVADQKNPSTVSE